MDQLEGRYQEGPGQGEQIPSVHESEAAHEAAGGVRHCSMSEQQNLPRSHFALTIHIHGFLIMCGAAAWLFPSKTDCCSSSHQSYQPVQWMSAGQIHPRPVKMAALLDPTLS